jgi:DNA-nicking Smr family endonuclease
MAKPKKKAKTPAAPDAFFRPFAKLAKKKASPAVAVAVAVPVPEPVNEHGSDSETFATYMAGVRALGDGATRIPRTASKVERKAAAVARPDPDAPAREALRTLVAEGVRFETTDDGERIEGRRLDTDPRDLRRLRRGAFAIDGRLDLHGLGVAEARAAVEAFVEKRTKLGDVAVILIHGKGSHSPRGNAVLRGELGAWLSHGPAARHVRAFTTAPEEDGGSGALLVLLAR